MTIAAQTNCLRCCNAELAVRTMPYDLAAFSGVFKRVLSTRTFDTLEPAPDHNIIVAIDRVPEDSSAPAGAARYRWSFGPAVETARTGYVVEVLGAAIPAESADLLAGYVRAPLASGSACGARLCRGFHRELSLSHRSPAARAPSLAAACCHCACSFRAATATACTGRTLAR